MNQRRRGFHVFGQDLTGADLSIYILMLATLLSLVASIVVGIIVNVLAAIAVLAASILVLLLSYVWYQVGATRQVQLLLEAEKIGIIKDPDGIFREGISALESGGWEEVRIYAPVGLWDPSKVKTDWLKALKASLEHGNVRSFLGVYALPLDKLAFETYAKKRLELFENTPNTVIHYLPPEDKKHPTAAAGLGAIVFMDPDTERYEAIFAFVEQVDGPRPMRRSGFVIRDDRVARLVTKWFDSQIVHDKSQTYVLRGHCPGKGDVNFKEEMAQIEQDYYASSGTDEALAKPKEIKVL